MAKSRVWLWAPAVCLTLAAGSAAGRKLEDWPYERLFKDADLVVVAEAEGAADADDKPTDPRLTNRVRARTSTLEVRATLKGKAPGAQIKVLHFRLKDGVLIDDGPRLVWFQTKGAGFAIVGGPQIRLGRPEYLLFLKARKDGRYEPVSGEYDPALSVREMHWPLDPLYEK